jgi:hypothetical protein
MEAGSVCIANIGRRERQKRMRFGLALFVVGLAILAALVAGGVHRAYRCSLLLVFWASALGFFQAREQT